MVRVWDKPEVSQLRCWEGLTWACRLTCTCQPQVNTAHLYLYSVSHPLRSIKEWEKRKQMRGEMPPPQINKILEDNNGIWFSFSFLHSVKCLCLRKSINHKWNPEWILERLRIWKHQTSLNPGEGVGLKTRGFTHKKELDPGSSPRPHSQVHWSSTTQQMTELPSEEA